MEENGPPLAAVKKGRDDREEGTLGYLRDLGFPGEYPFTRGVQPTMYRGRLWTMRQYAGFGTAEETNTRFRYPLDHGQTGLSIAFDLPAPLGYDSDHPPAEGEVGRVGVAVSSIADMQVLFKGIPLDKVTASMTINAPAAIRKWLSPWPTRRRTCRRRWTGARTPIPSAPHTVDPLAGSYYAESLTDRIEREAAAYLDRLQELGGAVEAIERGYIQREIHESAYRFQRDAEAGRRIIIGVSAYAGDQEPPSGLHRVAPDVEGAQLRRLADVRAGRDGTGVRDAADTLRHEAEGSGNLMPRFIAAVKARATLGEMCGVLRSVFGEYRAASLP